MRKLYKLIEDRIADNNSNICYCNKIQYFDKVIELGHENLVLYDVLLMILKTEREALDA